MANSQQQLSRGAMVKWLGPRFHPSSFPVFYLHMKMVSGEKGNPAKLKMIDRKKLTNRNLSWAAWDETGLIKSQSVAIFILKIYLGYKSLFTLGYKKIVSFS